MTSGAMVKAPAAAILAAVVATAKARLAAAHERRSKAVHQAAAAQTALDSLQRRLVSAPESEFDGLVEQVRSAEVACDGRKRQLADANADVVRAETELVKEDRSVAVAAFREKLAASAEARKRLNEILNFRLEEARAAARTWAEAMTAATVAIRSAPTEVQEELRIMLHGHGGAFGANPGELLAACSNPSTFKALLERRLL